MVSWVVQRGCLFLVMPSICGIGIILKVSRSESLDMVMSIRSEGGILVVFLVLAFSAIASPL